MTLADINAFCFPYMTPVHMCLYVYSDTTPKRPKKAGEERRRKTAVAGDLMSLLQITGQKMKVRTNWPVVFMVRVLSFINTSSLVRRNNSVIVIIRYKNKLIFIIVHVDSPCLLECRGGTWSSRFHKGSTSGRHSLHPPRIPVFTVAELVQNMGISTIL